jgi:hypothetical protein
VNGEKKMFFRENRKMTAKAILPLSLMRLWFGGLGVTSFFICPFVVLMAILMTMACWAL